MIRERIDDVRRRLTDAWETKVYDEEKSEKGVKRDKSWIRRSIEGSEDSKSRCRRVLSISLSFADRGYGGYWTPFRPIER